MEQFKELEWKPLASLAYAALASLIVVTQTPDVPQWAPALLSPLPILLVYAFRESSPVTPAAVRDARSLWRLVYATVVALVIVSQVGDVALWTIQMLAPLPILTIVAYKDSTESKAKTS